MKSNLIVIGNGFDLECGLKSSYSDFFDQRVSHDTYLSFNEVYKTYLIFKSRKFRSISFVNDETPDVVADDFAILLSGKHVNRMKGANLTFWDYVFLAIGISNDTMWHNVEENISWFLSSVESSQEPHGNIGLVPEKAKQINLYRFLCVISFVFLDNFRYNQSKDIYDFLFKELKLFEKEFDLYMHEEVTQKETFHEYDLNAYSLIQAIIDEYSSNTVERNCSVLSFNYTCPVCLKGNITNVHGTLADKNIIFGIDQQIVNSQSPLYRFTKTFRKLTQVRRSDNDVIISDKEKLKKIFFYGHSLSESDYSYFQSIFDYYDIYNSQIKLIFCCTHFDERKTKEEILQSQTFAASKLIETYGKEKVRNGKNLLHKLMLEDRVEVKIIKPKYKSVSNKVVS